jgi:Na+-driven multidrug efflux pump
VAAVGVFNTVSMLLIFPPLGVAQAMQPLAAFNRGSGQPLRVRALLGRTLATTSSMGLLSAVAVSMVPGLVAGLFTRTDTELVEIVRAGLPWCMLSVALFGVQGTASHYYLAMQQPRAAGLLLLGRQLLAIPLFLCLPLAFGFRGLYFAPLLSDLPFALLAASRIRSEWRGLAAGLPGLEVAALRATDSTPKAGAVS